MEWDLETLTKALDASVEFDEPYDCYRLRFSTVELKYELQIFPNLDQVLFAFDREQPIQPMPMAEYTFHCTLIDCYSEKVGGTPDGICFFEFGQGVPVGSPDALRLRLLPVDGVRWYAWCSSALVDKHVAQVPSTKHSTNAVSWIALALLLVGLAMPVVIGSGDHFTGVVNTALAVLGMASLALGLILSLLILTRK